MTIREINIKGNILYFINKGDTYKITIIPDDAGYINLYTWNGDCYVFVKGFHTLEDAINYGTSQ